MNEKKERGRKKGERGLGVPKKKGPTVQECFWNSRLEEENLEAVFFECLVFKIIGFELSYVVLQKH